jgi:hypothetical protein
MKDRVEIISPKLYENWRDDIEKIFAMVEKYFDIVDMDYGSTHIHVAPKDRDWTLFEVRKLARGIISLAEAVSVALPETRRIQQYAKMNGQDSWFSFSGRTKALFTLESIPVQVDGSNELQELINFMSPTRELAWNFQPLGDPTKGTIEFRRAPQSKSAKEALHWISVTLAMVASCLEEDDEVFDCLGEIEGRADTKLGLPNLYAGDSLFLFRVLLSGVAERLQLDKDLDFESDLWNERILQALPGEEGFEFYNDFI